MEALAELLIVFVCCGLVLIALAIIMYVASEIEHKLDMWLTKRTLKKKFGDDFE